MDSRTKPVTADVIEDPMKVNVLSTPKPIPTYSVLTASGIAPKVGPKYSIIAKPRSTLMKKTSKDVEEYTRRRGVTTHNTIETDITFALPILLERGPLAYEAAIIAAPITAKLRIRGFGLKRKMPSADA